MPDHTVLTRAAVSGSFDTIMIGLNLANRTGIKVAAEAKKQGNGVMAMYALRPFRSEASTESLLHASAMTAWEVAALLRAHGVESLRDAAMRFCQYHSGADVVLTGTAEILHLDANIAAAAAGPLPAPLAAELSRVFPGPGLDAAG